MQPHLLALVLSSLPLALCAALVLCLALAWRFREELAMKLFSLVFDLIIASYRSYPERCAALVRRVLADYSSELTQLLPLLNGLASPKAGPVQALRVGDYVSVEYVYRETSYAALLRYAEGAQIRRASAIVRGEASDVTERVRRFAGPSADFHGQRVRPREIVRGCESLAVEYTDDSVLLASADDVITLTYA
jgi:Family of unknown function (DUF5772)